LEIEKINERKQANQRTHLVGLQVPDVRLHPWNFVHMIDDSLMSSHHVRMDQSPTVRKYLFDRLFVCLFVCLLVCQLLFSLFLAELIVHLGRGLNATNVVDKERKHHTVQPCI